MGPTEKNAPGSDSDERAIISPGHAPLMTKVLNRLVAMGKAKPKTVSSLSKSLQSCTSIIPHMNPLDVLKIVNDQSDKPPPQVRTEQKAAPVYTRVDKSDTKFWDLAEHDRALTGQYFKYPPPEVKKVLLKRASKWLQSKPEGTEESLLHDLYQVCKTEHNEEPQEIVKNLQQMGFVNVDEGGAVTYNLPQHSDVLLIRGVLDHRASLLDTQLVVLLLCQYTRLWEHLDGYIHQLTNYNDSNYEWNPYSPDSDGIKETFCIGKTSFSLKADLADVQALFLLDGVEPKARPREMSDILEFIKPACTYLHLLIPTQVFVELRDKLPQRPVLEVRIKQNENRGLKTKVKDTLMLEFAIGTEKQEKTIPLTPEGLLGLDGVSPWVGGNRESSADGEELETVGRSRQFASMLQRHLIPLMQSQSAVLFEFTADQRSKILSKVSKWIDSYRLPDKPTEKEENEEREDDEEDGERAPSESETEAKPSIVRLQRELIAICNTCKVTRLPVETVVDLLQSYGFISVDETQNSISYNIPDVSTTKDNAPYWQVQATKYRKSSVEKCYSSFLFKYFPRVRGRRRGGVHKRRPKGVIIASTKIKHFLFGFVLFWLFTLVAFFVTSYLF